MLAKYSTFRPLHKTLIYDYLAKAQFSSVALTKILLPLHGVYIKGWELEGLSLCATNRNIATEASATTVFLSYEII